MWAGTGLFLPISPLLSSRLHHNNSQHLFLTFIFNELVPDFFFTSIISCQALVNWIMAASLLSLNLCDVKVLRNCLNYEMLHEVLSFSFFSFWWRANNNNNPLLPVGKRKGNG